MRKVLHVPAIDDVIFVLDWPDEQTIKYKLPYNVWCDMSPDLLAYLRCERKHRDEYASGVDWEILKSAAERFRCA